MLVAHSFKYSTPPKSRPSPSSDEKNGPRATVRPLTTDPKPPPRTPAQMPQLSHRQTTEPVSIPTKQSNAPSPPPERAVATRAATTTSQSMPSSRKSSTSRRDQRWHATHDPNALPPSIAALLAVTAIPPRRRSRQNSRTHRAEQISIDQLISQWRSDETYKSSYSSSPALSVLLEDANLLDDVDEFRKYGIADSVTLHARSAPDESVPDLESDDRSITSQGSPSTPGSLRSRKSSSNLRKDRARSLPVAEACALDHPLMVSRASDTEDADLFLSMQRIVTPARPSKTSFTSNLTTSLQTLKTAALNSLSSFSRHSNTPASSSNSAVPSGAVKSRQAAPPIDAMLWSHPFLFPRFSSESRPATDSHTDETDHHCLNPTPLTFEEQEAPFQQALHGPYLAEQSSPPAATTIQMQTYRTRGTPSSRRVGGNGRRGKSGPDPNSEAGRALLGAHALRPREVRENGDFLRVVVLEMNMRREGKLDVGRARIWLPPRESTVISNEGSGPGGPERKTVPKRWIGESAY